MIVSYTGKKTPTVEELVLKYCASGRFDLAFEVEYHDDLNTLKEDWLVLGKITTEDARGMFLKLRAEWSIKRKIDPSIWLAPMPPPPAIGS